ncbi:hypothetical protein CCU68_18775 [Pseudomonas gingeri NCPPB 3146 = LMG 5327]|uniref:Phage tail protein n=2 Tax=Pseudomonas gingeri TaxID=117681 RepID=A0A7Y8CD16_9PSED|nr:hypothetical protein [Pseudomonas gingeri]NWC14860.1 hypothetical protein [Pseudomonas gingeri]PNQ91023.1 hypothetical protein CCU68_18775 [Pseudomonas gingeri NCPPB 3146 = LMG 5327]
MDYPKSVPGVGLINGKFVDDNPVTGAPGSLIPSEWGNGVTDEILGVIKAAGINPDEFTLTQLLQAIRIINQDDSSRYGIDTGVANTYTVTYARNLQQLVDGTVLRFKAKTANTTASTFSPNGFPPTPIWSKKHAALTGGEIVANGSVTLVWNASLNVTGVWVLLQSSGGADQLPAGSYGATAAFGDSSTAVATTEYAQLLAGSMLSKNVSGGSTVTLTAVEGRYPIIALTGVLTSNIDLVVPSASKSWIVANNTTGSFSVTVRTQSGAGVIVAPDIALLLYCNGSSVFQANVADVASKQIFPVSTIVSSNALTLSLNPTSLDFRSPLLVSGAVNSRSVVSTISLVVPFGATLGTVAAQPSRLALLAIDNLGVVELAVVNLSGSNNLDETTLINTTAIGATATSSSVVYSATSRTGVPFRVVGFVDVTQATAGTWLSAPAITQGIGGMAVNALSYSQTWRNVLPSRASGVNYTNTTGRPIMVAVSNTTQFSALTAVVGGISLGSSNSYYPNSGGPASFMSFMVPPGAVYSVTGNAISQWSELR